MYAVIKTGGKQYRVREGDTILVEKLDADEGASVELNDVLMVADDDAVTIGTPIVSGATVAATVKAHGRGEKIRIIKFKRRKNYRRQMGHRQAYTELAIDGISLEKAAEPVAEQATEQVAEPMAEQATEQVAEPMAEQATEQATEQTGDNDGS